MKLYVSTPVFIKEARKQIVFASKNPIIDFIVQILLFVAMFLVINIAESVLMAIVMIVILFFDKSFFARMGIASQGNTDSTSVLDTTELSSQLLDSPFIIIILLFSTVIAIVIILLYCRFIEKRKASTLGLRRGQALGEYLMGLLIGAAMFGAVLAIGITCGALTYDGFMGVSPLIILLFIGFLVQSMSEELLCRGYFMVTLANRQRLSVAVLVSSCAFGLLHILNAGVNTLGIINIILFGIFAGVYMLKRGSIWGIAAIHATWNFTQGGIFGINVSGLTQPFSVFSFTPTDGFELMSGGTFGMEASLAATLVLALALIVALIMKPKDGDLRKR